jgi:hypothetical protein
VRLRIEHAQPALEPSHLEGDVTEPGEFARLSRCVFRMTDAQSRRDEYAMSARLAAHPSAG